MHYPPHVTCRCVTPLETCRCVTILHILYRCINHHPHTSIFPLVAISILASSELITLLPRFVTVTAMTTCSDGSRDGWDQAADAAWHTYNTSAVAGTGWWGASNLRTQSCHGGNADTGECDLSNRNTQWTTGSSDGHWGGWHGSARHSTDDGGLQAWVTPTQFGDYGAWTQDDILQFEIYRKEKELDIERRQICGEGLHPLMTIWFPTALVARSRNDTLGSCHGDVCRRMHQTVSFPYITTLQI